MMYEELLELVKKRRSIRKFKPGPLPEGSLQKIIEVARWAPSAFNSQPWDLVVVEKEALRKEIIHIFEDAASWRPKGNERISDASPADKLILSTPPKTSTFYNAAAFIIVFGDPRTTVALPPPLQTVPELRETLIRDSLANAYLYMHLAAASLGLAAQWWSLIAMPPIQSKVKQLLGIPDGMFAFDMIVLGLPGAKPRPKILRPLEKMVHFDDCGKEDFRTDAEVKRFAEKTKAWAIGTHRREYREE